MQPKDLKVGMVFDSPIYNHTIHIVKITEDFVTYGSNNSQYTADLPQYMFVDGLKLGGWKLKDKPLDQAFKELDKKLCSHRNIREDRFFSAMVYKTCKDCGKPLN